MAGLIFEAERRLVSTYARQRARTGGGRRWYEDMSFEKILSVRPGTALGTEEAGIDSGELALQALAAGVLGFCFHHLTTPESSHFIGVTVLHVSHCRISRPAVALGLSP
jgi:hypothetical protein